MSGSGVSGGPSPASALSPRQFESLVVRIFSQVHSLVDGLVVSAQERMVTPDGTYDIDATVRFVLGGMAFLVLVEAKHHVRPIERSLVQVLHSKVQSAGAQKGVLVATTSFQSGAIAYAKAHGIGLLRLDGGLSSWEVRDSISATGSRPGRRLVRCLDVSGKGSWPNDLTEHPKALLRMLVGSEGPP